MQLKTFYLQDKFGNALPGALCYVYEHGTTTLVTTLRDADGQPLGNPVSADAAGAVQVAAPDGLYSVRTVAGVFDRTVSVQFIDHRPAALAMELLELHGSNVDAVSENITQLQTVAGNVTQLQQVAPHVGAINTAVGYLETIGQLDIAAQVEQARVDAQAAAAAIGPIRFFDTLAGAQSAIPTLVEGDIVEISKDEGQDGVRSRRKFIGGVLVPLLLLDYPLRAEAVVTMPGYAELRAYGGTARTVMLTRDGIAGTFQLDASDTASTDNGGTIIVDALGRRWKRMIPGDVQLSWFDVKADGSDEAVKFIAAANVAAALVATLDMNGLHIGYGGGFYNAGTAKRVAWKNGGFKLMPGEKGSAAFFIDGVSIVEMYDLTLDGNRFNVSGNNAGFFVVRNADAASFDRIFIKDLRRYGLNLTPNIKAVKVGTVIAKDIGISGVALGEALKIEHSSNVTIDSFTCTNPSGTGGGQVAKVFHCKNVTLGKFDVTDADPAKVYPALSMVRNDNMTYGNVTVRGKCQVALEDNANINVTYDHVITEGTDKALIMGPDGAAYGNRRATNVTINSWIDTSTAAQAFNITAVFGLNINNLSTPQNINISRSSPAEDLRTENMELNSVVCRDLSMSLVMGRKVISNCKISGLFTNTGIGVTEFINSSYGSFSNSGQTNVFMVSRSAGDDTIVNISGVMPVGGRFTYRAPPAITNTPFSGDVFANSMFAGSPAGQWSQISWRFYDYGTPAVKKEIVQSGSYARSDIDMTAAWSTRSLTFQNNETVEIRIDASLRFIKNSA